MSRVSKVKVIRSILKGLAKHIPLAAIGVFFFLPLLWMVSTSLKADRQIFAFPPIWIPDPVIWRNYPDVFDFAPFLRYFRNTVIIVVLSIIGTLLSCSLVAYGFARLKAPGRGVLFIVMLSTMMIPFMVWMIPLYILFTRIGWIDSFLPLVVPTFFANPFYVFLLRQFFMTVPFDLEDAARIDGCSYLGTYWRIILPLAKPALAAVTIFTFMAHWNDFLGPLIFLQSPELFTLSLGLQVFQTTYSAQWGLLMAASTMIVLPVIVLFFFVQREFIQGVTLTGLKG
jgi:multiple sugar transport system permease protein